MISDKERRRIANELREAASAKGKRSGSMERMLSKLLGIAKQDMGVFGQPVDVAATWRDVYRSLAGLIEPQHIDGNTSDGYHAFNELYHHRAVLFSVIVGNFATRAWKSKLHADGTMYEGMFIVGIETPDGQATYHYDVEPYWHLFRCKEVERAPEWDGHTPDQAIERIGKLVDCKTDAWNTRAIDRDELLKIADELENEFFVVYDSYEDTIDHADCFVERIRKAVDA